MKGSAVRVRSAALKSCRSFLVQTQSRASPQRSSRLREAPSGAETTVSVSLPGGQRRACVSLRHGGTVGVLIAPRSRRSRGYCRAVAAVASRTPDDAGGVLGCDRTALEQAGILGPSRRSSCRWRRSRRPISRCSTSMTMAGWTSRPLGARSSSSSVGLRTVGRRRGSSSFPDETNFDPARVVAAEMRGDEFEDLVVGLGQAGHRPGAGRGDGVLAAPGRPATSTRSSPENTTSVPAHPSLTRRGRR